MLWRHVIAPSTMAFWVLCVACDRSPKTTDDVPEPGGTVRIALFEPLEVLVPFRVLNRSNRDLLVHVTPPLGIVNDQGTIDLRLARRYRDRGRAVEVVLRDLRWEDGEPVRAVDIVRTFELMRTPGVESPIRSRLGLIGASKALDDSTVRFEFHTRYGYRIRDTLVMPIASHVLPPNADPRRLGSWPIAKRPLSCGPFRVVQHTPRLVLARNTSSGFPAPHLDRVEVVRRSVEDAVREFRADSLDVLDDLPLESLEELRDVPGARAVALVGQSYVFLGWNLRDGRFSDPVVRRAAAQAVDGSRLVRDLLDGSGALARGPLVPGLGFTDTSTVFSHDPRAAARDLEQAGWQDEEGNGVRGRRGSRLAFHILVAERQPLQVETARAVARDLERIGMSAQVRIVSIQTLLTRLKNHTFEAFIGHWYPDDEFHLQAVWRSESTDLLNYGGYANPEVDRLVTRLGHENTAEEKARLRAEFQARVYADQPYLFLYQDPHLIVFSERVRGAEPRVVSTFWNLPEWWIPRALQRETPP